MKSVRRIIVQLCRNLTPHPALMRFTICRLSRTTTAHRSNTHRTNFSINQSINQSINHLLAISHASHIKDTYHFVDRIGPIIVIGCKLHFCLLIYRSSLALFTNCQRWPRPNMPEGRPIIADCGSESGQICEFIDFFLQPPAISHASYVKDTYYYVDTIGPFVCERV